MSLKIKAPEPLPPDGVTTVAFKAWKNTLFSFLEQDFNNYLFLTGGIYAQWTALADVHDRRRIKTILPDDPDKIKLDRKLTNAPDGYSRDDHSEDLRILLLSRNAQLSKFIQLICVACHYTEHDDISSLSTSTQWIINYLEQHYNLEKKGAHFLKVSELQYKQNTNYQTFYREFRAAIVDNLKKTGHKVHYLNDKELTEDETMSPTFEETIVLWCLEKIDPRLPMHVNKTFGHQMTGDTTLKDLQVTIFQRIPGMLQEIADAEHNRATALNATRSDSTRNDCDDDPHLSAFRPQSQRPRQQRVQQRVQQPARRSCQVCRLAGRPPAIVDSHSSNNCRLRNAILNAASAQAESEEDLLPFQQPASDEELVQ